LYGIILNLLGLPLYNIHIYVTSKAYFVHAMSINVLFSGFYVILQQYVIKKKMNKV